MMIRLPLAFGHADGLREKAAPGAPVHLDLGRARLMVNLKL